MDRPDLKELTIAQLFKDSCRKYPYNRALFDDEQSFNYEELDKLTDGIAWGLYSCGIRPGDMVCIFADTSVIAIAYYYAIQKLNAVTVFLPEKVAEAELSKYLDRAGFSAICCDKKHYEQFKGNNLVEAFAIKILTESVENALWPVVSGEESNIIDFPEDLINSGNPYDTAVMQFTSGTTGNPKIVMTSGYSRVNGGIQQAFDQNFTSEDIVMGALPIHHCFALSVNVMASLAAGAALYIPKDRHTDTILTALNKYRCTVMSAVPSLYNAILKNPDFDSRKISLRTGIIGGGRYTPKMFKEIEEGFAPTFTLLSSLGMTEGTAGVTVCEADDDVEIRSTTVGHFMAYVEGRIVNPESGEICRQGESGEICFKGYNVMQGYYMNPEATNKTIDNEGFLHSGDIGYLNDNGYLFLSGRLKEIIIRGGENISPVEIENTIYEDSRVGECKVVGIHDDHYGEIAVAFIVAKEPLSEAEIKAEISSKLVAYKIPSAFYFIDEMPLNGNGKINTNELKKMAEKH